MLLIGPAANPGLWLVAPEIPGAAVATHVKVAPGPLEAASGILSATPLQVPEGANVETNGLGLTVTLKVAAVPTQP